VNCCNNIHNICVTRGDVFELNTALAKGWDNVKKAPHSYQIRMAFRHKQQDQLPTLLETMATPRVEDMPDFGEVVSVSLHLTAAETSSLPPFDIVYFCELAPISNPDSSHRLFEGRVRIGD
jgi:hypothetical protein